MAGYMSKILGKGKAEVAQAISKMEESSKIFAGDPALDWCIGSYARSRLNLVYGPSKSGKSTLTVMAAAQEQKRTGGHVIIYDSEYYYKNDAEQAARLTTFGLDIEKTIIISSNQIDELFYGLNDLEDDVKSGKLKVAAIIIDSWGGIQSEQAEAKIAANKISDAGNSFGGNAKFMNPILGQLLRICAENDVSMFAVQHCIKNMEPYGSPWVLIGGERLRFLANRILFVEGSSAKNSKITEGDLILGNESDADAEAEDGVIVGKKILARCEKSRSVVEGRKVEFFINFDQCRFAKPELSLFTLASGLGVIGHPVDAETGKANNTYWVYPANEFGMKVKGKTNMIKALSEDKNLYTKVFQDCLASGKKSATAEQMSDVKIVESQAEVEKADKEAKVSKRAKN